MTSSYRDAGVDIAAGERAVDLMRASIARTSGPEVIGGLGGFAGLFDATRLTTMRRPLLATSTDGVGTKVLIASRLGVYDTVGIDLVGMVVDDLVVCGAQPLFMTDYMVFGSLQPERAAAILSGVAEGCVRAGCALIGGETAEHPGHLGPDDFDLAGAATGVVDAGDLLGPHRVQPGDVVVALASSGLHSNGFSLVRRVLERARLDLAAGLPGIPGTLGAELLTPTRIYARDCLALAAGCDVHAYAHITGGGPGRQPGPGTARGGRRGPGPGDLAATGCVRAPRGAWRGSGGRDGTGVQHGRRHGRRARPRGRRPRPRHAGRPRPPGVGDRRDRARHGDRPAGRTAPGSRLGPQARPSGPLRPAHV